MRGPFSALYGSEAIGGVVRVFTRKGAAEEELSGRATLALGNRSAKEAFAEIALGSGPLTGSAGFRRTLTDGDYPNEFFEATNVSGSVSAALTDALRVGLVAASRRRADGHSVLRRDCDAAPCDDERDDDVRGARLARALGEVVPSKRRSGG